MTEPNPTVTLIGPKDGALVVKEGEAEVRYVKESDLMAVKGGAEAATKRLKEAETIHQTEIASFNGKLNEASTKLLQAEAAKEQLEEQLKGSATSAEEVAKNKAALEEANKKIADLSTKVLEAKKKLITTTFKTSPDALKDKTLEQLDSLEEALNLINAGKKPGVALGGGGSGGAFQGSNIDRAKAIIAEAEAKGKGSASESHV